MSLHSPPRPKASRAEQGYVLLTLLLIICMMIIFAAAIVPSITFNIKRDREEEMIHRGVQYSRAIRAYYKKFGRYPTKIEDLENTNNQRFLRKRYKDPLNCKNSKCEDFKLLHFGDVKLTFSGAAGGGGINGASSLNGASPFGQQSPQPGGLSGGGLNGGGLSNSGGFGGTQNSFGSNSNTAQGTNSTAPPDQTTQAGNADPNAPPGQGDANGGDKLAGVTFGGGPIVGVVSASKKDTIREFNHKKKYNEWQFIYDPATDRGGLLMTPNQPPIMGFGQAGTPAGTGTNGGFGNGVGTTGTGLQNNPGAPVGGAPGTTGGPNSPQQQ